MPSSPPFPRANGRLLADFGALLPAEKILVAACRAGEEAHIGPGSRPEEVQDNLRIRAGVLRVLCLCQDPTAPMHEHGIWLYGAWIDGDLDLAGCAVPFTIRILQCHFGGEISLYRSTLKLISLSGSETQKISADGLHCEDDIVLRDGFIANGEVRLIGVTIGGDLACSNSKFNASQGHSLVLDRATISGGVFLNGDFAASGSVSLPGVSIGSTLACSGGKFGSKTGAALWLNGAKISGDVLLDDGFSADSLVFLSGSIIGGDFRCSNSTFHAEKGDALNFERARISGNVLLNRGFSTNRTVRLSSAIIEGNILCADGHFQVDNDDALVLDGAKIYGDVLLGRNFSALGTVRLPGVHIEGDFSCRGGAFSAQKRHALVLEGARVAGSAFLDEDFEVNGTVNLADAKIGTLVDSPHCWRAPTLILDGLRWSRFGGSTPTTYASGRIFWLEQQPSTHLKDDFRPQPWEQCAKVLSEMGHERDATKIRIEKRKRMRFLDWRRSPSLWAKAKRVPSIVFDVVLWATVAYGYRPLLAGLWLLGLWMVAGVAFTSLVPPTVMTPTDARVYLASTIPDACRDDWINFDPPTRPTDTPQRIRWSETFHLPIDDRGGSPVPASWREICTRTMPSEYTTFSPWVYTLDLLLPIVDLRQEKDWAPRVTDANGDVLAPLWSGASIGLGHVTRFGEWTLILLGWVLSALLIGAVTGIIRRD